LANLQRLAISIWLIFSISSSNRLSLGFPDEVEGYRKYTQQAGWWKEVQRKIGK